MLSEYKHQYRQHGTLLDAWTNIPVNTKEALHNKFKGRGNYALLDDLVGGDGNILRRYNAFCKKNGMPCFVKCCSNNEDCVNVSCTSDGRRDDARFSSYECVLDPSHAIIRKPNPSTTGCDAAVEPTTPCFAVGPHCDASDEGGGSGCGCARGGGCGGSGCGNDCGGARGCGGGGCGDGDRCDGVGDVNAQSCSCSMNRRYKCPCDEPRPWCALCSETKKCQLDEVDADWRGICQEVFAFDERVGLSMKTKLKGLLSRMEYLETVWLCENCRQFLMARIDVLRTCRPCPFPTEPRENVVRNCRPCIQIPARCHGSMRAGCGCDSNGPSCSKMTWNGVPNESLADEVPAAERKASAASSERGKRGASREMGGKNETKPKTDGAKSTTSHHSPMRTNGEDGVKSSTSIGTKSRHSMSTKSHHSPMRTNGEDGVRSSTSIGTKSPQSMSTKSHHSPMQTNGEDGVKSSTSIGTKGRHFTKPINGKDGSFVSSAKNNPGSKIATITEESSAAAPSPATSAVPVARTASKKTSVMPKMREEASQNNSNVFRDCQDCQCCR